MRVLSQASNLMRQLCPRLVSPYLGEHSAALAAKMVSSPGTQRLPLAFEARLRPRGASVERQEAGLLPRRQPERFRVLTKTPQCRIELPTARPRRPSPAVVRSTKTMDHRGCRSSLPARLFQFSAR